MGNFLDVMIVMKDINEDLEDGNGLANFIGMLKNFNGGDPISIKLKENLEDYFDYRWNNNKNWSIESESDI